MTTPDCTCPRGGGGAAGRSICMGGANPGGRNGGTGRRRRCRRSGRCRCCRGARRCRWHRQLLQHKHPVLFRSRCILGLGVVHLTPLSVERGAIAASTLLSSILLWPPLPSLRTTLPSSASSTAAASSSRSPRLWLFRAISGKVPHLLTVVTSNVRRVGSSNPSARKLPRLLLRNPTVTGDVPDPAAIKSAAFPLDPLLYRTDTLSTQCPCVDSHK